MAPRPHGPMWVRRFDESSPFTSSYDHFFSQLAMSGSIGSSDLIWTHDVCFSVLVLVLLKGVAASFDTALG